MLPAPRRNPHRPARRALLRATTLVVLASACATGGQASLDDLPAAEYVGHYTNGRPGESWFRPCGQESHAPAWWVTWTGRAVTQADSVRRSGLLASGASTFVRLRAAADTSGATGPGGRGSTALLVRELLEARAATPGDCAAR